jgi:hydroxyacylglutathione hydrolase
MQADKAGIQIQPIAAFSDNYIWLLYNTENRRACVVDPGDAQPVLAVLNELNLELTDVLITHHHFDHVGGLKELKNAYSPRVYGPNNPAITGISQVVTAGEQVEVLGLEFQVQEVPGHTLDHIAYFHHGEEPLLFCGDTLFAGGCGRLFEGTPTMMHKSLQSLAVLPPTTRVYCAHEYTLANLAFALAVEPDNTDLQQRIAEAEVTRASDRPTIPSNISLELATNPFLRCSNVDLRASLASQGRSSEGSDSDVFATVRAWKDKF